MTEINQLKETMTISAFEVVTWFDDRLAFDTNGNQAKCVVGAGDGQLTWISVDPKELEGDLKSMWSPDLYVTNAVGKGHVGETAIYVYMSGKVQYIRQKSITTSCPMDFSKYPFDKQACSVTVSSFSQSSQEIDLQASLGEFDTGSFVGTDLLVRGAHWAGNSVGQFDIISDTTLTNSVMYSENNRIFLKGTLKFERDTNSFWLNTFMPDAILQVGIWVSFWLSPSSAPARITLCIIGALSFRILMTSILAELPSVSYSVW